MDEIKLRAWDKKYKKMYYHDHTDTACDGKNYEYTSSVIVTPHKDSQLEWLLCTGLKDRNNKEIYEGDLIMNGESLRFVEYMWGNPVATRIDGSETILLSYISTQKILSRRCEIIGNKYENSDLLKESKNE